jgi:hypothetical protein
MNHVIGLIGELKDGLVFVNFVADVLSISVELSNGL